LVSIGGVILAREHLAQVSSPESNLGRYAIGAPRGHSGPNRPGAPQPKPSQGFGYGDECKISARCAALAAAIEVADLVLSLPAGRSL
jgi:hypothetical protein